MAKWGILLLFIIPWSGFSQELFYNAKTVATSGANHSYSVGTSAFFANPAGMSIFRNYMTEVSYQYDNSGKIHSIFTGITDSYNNRYIAGGLSYLYLTGDSIKGHNLNIAASTQIPLSNVAIFLGGEYKYYSLSLDGKDTSVHDANFGAVIAIMNYVKIGIVGHNVFENIVNGYTSRAVTAGLSLGTGSLILAFDATFDFTKKPEDKKFEMIYAAGAEYLINRNFVLKAGYQKNKVIDSSFMSFGMGFLIKRVGFDISYLQNLDNTKDLLINTAIFVYVL